MSTQAYTGCSRQKPKPTARHIFAMLLCASLAMSCGGSSGGGDGVASVQIDNGSLRVVIVSDCPPCNALATDTGYDRFLFSSNVTNQTAQSIQQVCGFRTVRDHLGMNGDNLQIAGCSSGVEFAFVSNRFRAFALRDGFVGVFNGSIRIGDRLELVLQSDPGLVQVDPLTFVRDLGDTRIEANFDSDLRLRELVVGRGFLR